MTDPRLEHARHVASPVRAGDADTGEEVTARVMHAGPATSDDVDRHVLIEFTQETETEPGYRIFLSGDEATALAEQLTKMARWASMYVPRSQR